MKKIISLVLIISMLVATLTGAIYVSGEEYDSSKVFVDVPSDAWFRTSVDFVASRGIMGGIDSIIDRPDSTEEEIRAEVRKVCETFGPGGHFIPSITYGLPGSLYPHVSPIITDEISKYNKEVYGIG